MENTSFEAENMTGGTAQNTTVQYAGFTNLKVFFCIFFPTIVLGLIGNGLVIFLTGCRMKKTVNSIWFLNLAAADFIFLFSSCMLSLALQWRISLIYVIFCIISPINLFASIFFLVVISLDRCLCTWMVVWAQNKRTLLRARIICIIVWVSSIGCTILFFVLPSIPTFLPSSFVFLITYEFTVGFLIPFLIIASSYIAIGVRIKRFKGRKQLRSYRVIILILAFFICSFPFHVWCFYTVQLNYEIVFGIVSVYLLHLNSCLNPILYVFMCDEYKKKLKQSLQLVLETAFAEDHLHFSADGSGQAGQENQTELLDL
ncbi:C3a anaphylatoxin chemotactic receptor-like [Labeo rohita]|uniref:C3a anaphylatoxin chemotactic receptor-like n=1 Tax=Labeo rohita TaxID=84645 RepID=UPI0021E2ADB9|nr:C3a anaphylatoxin chemotactic receptor-like [Labeo rohita]